MGWVADWSARLTVRGGRAIRLSGLVLEPAVGVGAVRTPVEFPSETEVQWTVWYGGSLTLRPDGIPVGFQLEYGRREVPTRYYVYRSGWETVHEFRRWGDVLRLSLTL